MKILTLIGSPRKKGNSFKAAKEIETEMRRMGDYEFEYLFLSDTHLEDCKGCFNCVSKGIKYCPLKDDCELILKKMAAADGLILVSPVYVMTVTSLLKKFIDRVAYLSHRPAYHGKMALLLSTTAGLGADDTLKYMKTIVESWGYRVTGKCGLVTAPWPPTNGLKKKNEKVIHKSITQFDKSLKSVENKPINEIKVSIKDYLSFRIFKSVAENVREYMPADFEFYKDKEYYYPTKIGLFTKLLANITIKFIFFMMRDMGPGDMDKKNE